MAFVKWVVFGVNCVDVLRFGCMNGMFWGYSILCGDEDIVICSYFSNYKKPIFIN